MTFGYDAAGALAVKTVVTPNTLTTTHYVGGFYERTVGGTTRRYYRLGDQLALYDGTAYHYLYGDQLNSAVLTTSANGTKTSETRYYPYGAHRYDWGNDPSDRDFTGQRRDAEIALLDYVARRYSPYLGRFVSPDSIVPQPANPQSLNRYAYVLNNPLRFVDPSGMAECAAGDQQCWVNEFNFKNNWYNARGYRWGGSHWDQVDAPIFANEQVTDEVIQDAGITLASFPNSWSWANKQKVAYGAAKFGQKLSTGIAGLRSLLGSGATLHLGPNCFGAGCAPPFPWTTDAHRVYFPLRAFNSADLVGGAQWVVHELAHVVDWQGGFSQRWPFDGLTDYANGRNIPWIYPERWDRWAEAVTVWVFGNVDANGGFVTSYKSGEVSRRITADKLTVQMGRLQALLEGW